MKSAQHSTKRFRSEGLSEQPAMSTTRATLITVAALLLALTVALVLSYLLPD
jgi:hypothetical protein